MSMIETHFSTFIWTQKLFPTFLTARNTIDICSIGI